MRSLEKKIYCKIYGLYEVENSEEVDWYIWNLIYRGCSNGLELEKDVLKI